MTATSTYGYPAAGLRLPLSLAASLCLAALATSAMADAATPASPPQGAGLLDLPIDKLMDIQVTSVAKKPQRLADAAAAVTVIDADQIERSGMTSVPELLRLVPGMDVAQLDNQTWAISARGFNSVFSDKLLVLIDGRSVYTPI